MANKTSYAHQVELLGIMKEQLENFKTALASVTVNYEASIQHLHKEEGLMDETFEEFSVNYMTPTMGVINSIIERIDTEDLAFIDKEINFLVSR